MSRTVVIGGGAAGMMAAAAAAQSGEKVTLYEKNERLGRKLSVTGKGRCNVTNACDRDGFLEHICSNPRFLYSSYERWSSRDMCEFLTQRGLPLKVERGGRVFPVSDRAADVVRTLQTALEEAGVVCRFGTPVCSLWLERGEPDPACPGKKGPAGVCRGVILPGGRKEEADRVIVAAGGLAAPSTGSTGDGLRFAREAGLAVTECYPALVPFDACLEDGSSCEVLQGLSPKNVGIRIYQGNRLLTEDFGEMLFTHFGVSGPLMLTASSRVAKEIRQGELTLLIDWKPALSREQLDARLRRELAEGAQKQMKNLLKHLFPAKLVPVMLEQTGLDPYGKAGEITRAQRTALLEKTKAFPVRLLRTRDYREAIVTGGGVSVKEICPSTMEAKKIRGLYFAGEVLDLDGTTGGYNLQIAWSTGHAAGCAGQGGGQDESESETEPEHCD